MSASTTVVDEIMKHMPKDAEKYLVENGSGFTLSIHWKLKNDSERPNKYSKTIIIFIPQELIEDFPNYPSNLQQSALTKIGSYISGQLKVFDPNHDAPRYIQPPTETWAIPIERLFG